MRPTPPVDVRLVLDDGTEHAIEVRYAGVDHRGLHEWVCTELLPADYQRPGRVAAITAKLLPPRTFVTVPIGG